MAKDTITLALDGEVDLHRFAVAVSHLEGLVQGLSRENGVENIRWVIYDLQAGSAMATVRGESDILEKVERVVSAYEDVGQSLQAGKRPDYSEPVVKAASAIIAVLGDKVTAVRFETPEREFTVASRPEIAIASATMKSFGAIEGRIQTLSNRKGLRFVLFDTLHDRAISCYLSEGQEELMREIWGKRAIVEGEITREKDTGRPLAIRHIADIKALEEIQRGSYLRARGVAPRKPGTPLAEVIIRQLRDA
ncbi:MAG: hypothetical protein HY670_04165 [Chloroflexi bacterium]|nr:hypothetical protein [Chloroflexota bacterium]